MEITLTEQTRIFSEAVPGRLSLEGREYLPIGHTVNVTERAEKIFHNKKQLALGFVCEVRGLRWILASNLPAMVIN